MHWTPEQLAEMRRLIAGGASSRIVADIMDCSKTAALKAARDHGLGAYTNTGGYPSKAAPADFVQQWRRLGSQEALAAHYGCAINTVRKHEIALGLTRTARVRADRQKPPAKLVAFHKPVMAAVGVTCDAQRAVDFLRRYGSVWRCNGAGQYSPKGGYWRRGTSILTDAEVIERATRLGFDPDAWSRIAA